MKIKKDLISIITVTYNAEDFLEETILSVIRQTYKNIEYIIIDGASTDGTLDIIKKYEDHISYWISEPDGGIYDAMNKGIDKATGEWINFMNAGDGFVCISIVETVFNQIPNDTEIVYGNTRFIDEFGEECYIEIGRDAKEYLWEGMVCNHNSLFCKTALMKKHPFNTFYKIVADSEFLIWALKEEKVFHHLNILINYFLIGGLSWEHATQRLVERWKLVTDNKMNDQQSIDNHYFPRIENKINLTTVSIEDNNTSFNFTVEPKSEDVIVAFYLYRNSKHIDTQWYSKNFSYQMDKREYGTGAYKIRYFIVNEHVKNPGSESRKEMGFSETITINKLPYNKLPDTVGKSFLLPADDLETYPDKKFCISENENPIMIFQVGKVGSSTMAKSLKSVIHDLPIYQIHNIETAKELLHKENSLGYKGGLYHFTTGKTLKDIIQKNPEIRWKVIVGVREPIKRWVSDIFQNINERYAHFYDDNGHIKQQDLIEFIHQSIETEPMQTWFNEELRKTFGINVFKYNFDKINGYTIIKEKNVDILVYQTEKIKDSFAMMMKEFLSLDLTHPDNANVSSNKSYVNAYKSILHNLKFDERYLKKFYKRAITSHFYSASDIKDFINTWKK